MGVSMASQLAGMMVSNENRLRESATMAVRGDDAGLEHRDGLLFRDGVAFTGTMFMNGHDGCLAAVTLYLDGARHGEALTWYPGGKLATSRWYEAGVKVGRHRGYWPNGRPRFLTSFVAGRYQGAQQSWHQDGSLAEIRHYLLGRENGEQRSWSRGGELRANYVVRHGRRYGLLGAKPCFTVKGESS